MCHTRLGGAGVEKCDRKSRSGSPSSRGASGFLRSRQDDLEHCVENHLVDCDKGLLRWLAWSTFLRAVDASSKYICGICECFLAIVFWKFDCLVSKDSLETSDDVLSEFGESGLHGGFYHRCDFIACASTL